MRPPGATGLLAGGGWAVENKRHRWWWGDHQGRLDADGAVGRRGGAEMGELLAWREGEEW